jgi:cystathionine beta-lyase/cystathionine gamma-synthase
LASLEAAEEAVAFGSGMAAITAVFTAVGLSAGDVIVAARDLYGVSRAFFAQLEDADIQTRYVDPIDERAVEAALGDASARVFYFETIANPLLQVPDVDRLVAIARRLRKTVVLDNTFATPYLFRGLEHGVDLEIHSATKYIAGHGDVTAGTVGAGTSWAGRVRSVRTVTGGILSPFEAWLTLRGIRTLPLRMERHCESALEIARWLEGKPWTARVYYPGLPASPHHAVANREFGDRFGGMVAFDLAGSQSEALAFMDALAVIAAGTSLGDAGSLALYPALSSHRTLEPASRREAGIGDGLIRLSIGLESPKDLMVDLERAAQKSGVATRREVGV